jgi:hypothetical protein
MGQQMVEVVVCQCGCGTPLKARKDGTYARYTPGGHDSKHKSALVRAALDGDKKAEKTLAECGWTKFLDKARTVRQHKTKTAVKPRDNRKVIGRGIILYGMTERELKLLRFPPTPSSWYCMQSHAGNGPVIVSGDNDFCVFCGEERSDDAPLVWPEYVAAMKKFEGVNWEEITDKAELDVRFRPGATPSAVETARQLLRMRTKYAPPETDEPEQS